MPRKKKQVREGIRTVGYVRVSTATQAEDGLSLEAQRTRINSYCEFRGLDLVELVTDPATSGKLPLAGRQGGGRLLELLKDPTMGHIVGLKLDRLFRNTMDCLQTTEGWEEQGVAFHLVDMGGQPLDTSSAMGRLFLTVMAAIAEWEAAVISERTILALDEKRAAGEDLGQAPYGQRWDKDKHVLEINKEEERVVKLIEELRSRGWSLRRITNHLNDQGVAARGERWHHTTIDRILRRSRGNEETTMPEKQHEDTVESPKR